MAVLLLFIAIPITARQQYPKIEVVRTTKAIEKGTILDQSSLESVCVGSLNLADTTVTDIYQCIGRYAAVDLVEDDILLTDKISQIPFRNGEQVVLLPKGNETAAVRVRIMDGSEIAELKTGDIIKMNGYDHGLIDIPALNFVRVITVMEPTEDGTFWITVSANPRQWNFLLKHRQDLFHVSVMVRENEELAEKLLQQQAKYFQEET